MPDYVKFLFRHALIGFSIGVAAAIALVVLDVGHIGRLIGDSDQQWLVFGLLAFLLGLTFGSVQMGFAIMLIPSDD